MMHTTTMNNKAASLRKRRNFSIAALSKILLVLVCGIVSVKSQDFSQETGENDPLLENWIKEEGLASLINNKLDSTLSPTTVPSISPTDFPTASPTFRPTMTPTKSPTNLPTASPTTSPSLAPSISQVPSSSPSSVPSISAEPSSKPTGVPSSTPSAHPTARPSLTPSSEPSSLPSSKPTMEPSSSPSSEPTSTPSISHKPSDIPSESPSESLPPTSYPTKKPTKHPTLNPTESPTTSPTVSPTESPPTLSPTQSMSPTTWKTSSSIIINDSKAKKSTSLLIVGACCFVVMASTGAYLYRRNSQHQLGNRDGAPMMIEVMPDKDFKDGSGIISPFSHDGLRMGPSFGAASGMFDDRYGDDGEDRNGARDENSMERDLEGGRNNGGIPSSVDIEASPRQADIEGTSSNNLTSINEGMVHSGNSMFHIPKLFQRPPKGSGQNTKKKTLTWAQMREEASPCSSGYAPASAASPMFSPVFIRGLSSVLTPYSNKMLPVGSMDKPCDDQATPLEKCDSSSNENSTKEEVESFSKEYDKQMGNSTASGDAHSESLSKSNSEETESLAGVSAIHQQADNRSKGADTTKRESLGSMTSTGSSVEWDIDVGPSVPSYDENLDKLKNLLVSMSEDSKPLAITNGEESRLSPRDDVQLMYSEEENEEESIQRKDEQMRASFCSDSTSAFLGDINVSPCASEKFNSVMKSPDPVISPQQNDGLTFEMELLHSSELGGRPINFHHVFNDPNNELYECHAPPGSLGVVIDATPLGPRVNSLSPLSPLFGTVAPGDIFVGIDEIDTVGMEAGDFMQIVTQRSNERVRVLTVLKI